MPSRVRRGSQAPGNRSLYYLVQLKLYKQKINKTFESKSSVITSLNQGVPPSLCVTLVLKSSGFWCLAFYPIWRGKYYKCAPQKRDNRRISARTKFARNVPARKKPYFLAHFPINVLLLCKA